jgi:glutathionylspermidine synthase
MRRIQISPRKDYQKKLEQLSFNFHSLNNIYWDESAYYKFSNTEVDAIEKATNDIFEMCLQAVQHVIDNKLYNKLHIDPNLIPLIERSWENEEPSVYGRFDFAYTTGGVPKMLEFNADTPTSLYECSVVQWYWLQEIAKDKDQFNSIHEKLIDYWKSCLEYFNGETVYFTCVRESIEDLTTVEYLRDTAHQAGLITNFIYIDEIGWDNKRNIFVDMNEKPISNIFKLYPYEWIIAEDFGVNILKDTNQSKWIEPAWKAILSNKGILPILWELFPDHPNLLECYYDEPKSMVDYVSKPIYSREGANITIYDKCSVEVETDGEYGDEGFVFQQKADLSYQDGNYAIIGSWVIGGEAAGMSIRESHTMITDNLSRFIPHLIED